MCRQALCKDSNYQPLLGLIRLPSLDVLARGGWWVAGGGEGEEEDDVAVLSYNTKDTRKQGCNVTTNYIRPDKQSSVWLIFLARR